MRWNALTACKDKTSNIYDLPKIYKNKIISNAVKNNIAEVMELLRNGMCRWGVKGVVPLNIFKFARKLVKS